VVALGLRAERGLNTTTDSAVVLATKQRSAQGLTADFGKAAPKADTIGSAASVRAGSK